MIANFEGVPSIYRQSEGHLNVATGTREIKDPEKDLGRRGLTLVSKPGQVSTSKKLFRIGVCDNVFSGRKRTVDDSPADEPQRPTVSISRSKEVDLSVIFTVAAFGLVFGYLVGRSSR